MSSYALTRLLVITFTAELQIVDGNPYVRVPTEILEKLFVDAKKSSSPIPICGTVNGKPFVQTLVKFRGAWRLYVNMNMLPDSPRRIGETVSVYVAYDPNDRTIEPHPKLVQALNDNVEALEVFESLSPSSRKEIIRYIASLKTESSIDRNVQRAIRFLLGEDRFVGRDKPNI